MPVKQKARYMGKKNHSIHGNKQEINVSICPTS